MTDRNQAAWDALRRERDELAQQVEWMRSALHKLACLGNGDAYGNSTGNCIAQGALALPNISTGILRKRDAGVARDIATNWLPNVRRHESESSLTKTAHNQAVDGCIKHVLSYVAAKEANHG